MKQIHKDYAQAFLLEPTKLTRLVNLIHERLGDHVKTSVRDHFEVFVSGNRREEMDSIDDVLAVENSRKQKIERLLITCSATVEGASRPEHEVQVDFGQTKIATSPGTPGQKVIAVSVRSDVSGWASRTLSEVEEQIERTRLHYGSPFVALLGLLVFMFVVFLSQFVRFDSSFGLSRVMWLDQASLDRVEKILSQGRPITDEEMREITTLQLQNLLLDQRPKQPPAKGLSRRFLIFGLPLLVVLGLMLTLVFTCYPSAVFLWGDEVERYANIRQRRKAIWGIIIALIFVGVLSKLFSEGVASWVPKE